MALALVFPGQGSQDAGMGRELAAAFAPARAVFDEVDAALGEKLSTLMFEGPKETLTLTQNAQPALMAVSMAAMAVLKSEFGLDLAKSVKCVAGHSLGEYSALAAAGTFSLADTARLLRLRGQAMQAAVPVGEGAMAALLGVDLATARIIAAEAAQGVVGGAANTKLVCDVANDNDPGQIVLSGHRAAVERVAEAGKAHGLRRAVMLPVSAPFHCALMKPAADAMAAALAKVAMRAPAVPVIANVTAAPVSDPAEIARLLVAQVTGTVRWRECVLAMAGMGVTNVIEVGSGKVLAGLVKRIDKALNAISVGAPADIEAAKPLLSG